MRIAHRPVDDAGRPGRRDGGGLGRRARLDGRDCDLAVVFASGSHLAAPEATLAAVQRCSRPPTLVGCGAGGVSPTAARSRTARPSRSGRRRSATARRAVPRHGRGDRGGRARYRPARPRRRRRRDPARRSVLVPDRRGPALLERARHRCCRCWAAWRRRAGPTTAGPVPRRGGRRRRRGRRAPRRRRGAAVRLAGRGADRARADHHRGRRARHRRARGPTALAKLREAIEALSDADRETVDAGTADGHRGRREQARARAGRLPRARARRRRPGDRRGGRRHQVRPGQVVRLHARDAASADRDLHAALEQRMEAPGPPARGAIVFACNGRGSGMFGRPDHDAGRSPSELGGAPAAGFFAAGEIGPVGGETSCTASAATVAVFAAWTCADADVSSPGRRRTRRSDRPRARGAGREARPDRAPARGARAARGGAGGRGVVPTFRPRRAGAARRAGGSGRRVRLERGAARGRVRSTSTPRSSSTGRST